ncbi:Fungal specific transcription factor [Sporothrix eucalyptigena]|uniref:Fungal specific transcription factor n=1 Tax=Sporothrix eucalyptigena TaxID=1812306 RepID=A0ABP0AZ36_9PEZI
MSFPTPTATAARTRPCDMCRTRKTRCVKPPDKGDCVLCAFHGKQCTYERGPVMRSRRRLGTTATTPTSAPTSAPANGTPTSPRGGSQPNSTPRARAQRASFSSASSGGTSGVMSDGDRLGARPDTETAETDTAIPDGDRPELSLLLDGTLGLDLNTHPEMIGPSHYLEPALLDLYRVGQTTSTNTSAPRVRRVDAKTVFLMQPDEGAASEMQRLADCDAVEACVRPLGPALIQLYFRLVHPTYPILHRRVFVTKYAVSHRLFSPPLLAAVFLAALDYRLYLDGPDRYDDAERQADRQAALEQIAQRTMADDLKRPKLSTLEAGLLLLQHSRAGGSAPTSYFGGPSFLAQMVALAQGLGLHVDCTAWAIPAWEKGLRRRLAWALYAQDHWLSVLKGRPPLLSHRSWGLDRLLDANDFEAEVEGEEAENNKQRDGVDHDVADTRLGAALFVHQIALAQMLSQITNAMARFDENPQQPASTVALVEASKPWVLRLRAWHTALPPELGMDRLRPGRLSGNASLHLAHAAVDVLLQRVLLRAVTPETPPPLAQAVRTMARQRVQTAVALIMSMQPEHTGAFVGSAAAYQVALVGSLAGLLWATTESAEEMAWCVERMGSLRQFLQVRGHAAAFVADALRLLNETLGPMQHQQLA